VTGPLTQRIRSVQKYYCRSDNRLYVDMPIKECYIIIIREKTCTLKAPRVHISGIHCNYRSLGLVVTWSHVTLVVCNVTIDRPTCYYYYYYYYYCYYYVAVVDVTSVKIYAYTSSVIKMSPYDWLYTLLRTITPRAYIYIYIYIYMCVCVCVCVFRGVLTRV